jgi:hypothetical protein
LTVCAAAAAMALPARPVLAQVQGGPEAPEASTPERQDVLQRGRPDYDPLGLRAGGFLIFPTADVTESYDSNVYALQTGVKGDFYSTLSPTIQATSDWPVHAVNLRLHADTKRYSTDVTEDVSNYSALASGRLDVVEGVYISGGAGFEEGHEDRSSPNSLTNQKTPTEYRLTTGNLGFVHEVGYLGLRLDSGINYYDYSNGTTNGGIPIVETDRDRVEIGVVPRLTYEVLPGYHAFVKVPVNWREYTTKIDTTGLHRSSFGYEVDAGTAVDLGHLLNGEAFVGYHEQDFEDARLAAAQGPTFGGNILWNVAEAISLRGLVTRTIEEITSISASSITQTAFNLSGQYEALPNLLLSAQAGYVTQVFNGTPRIDDLYSGELSARYLINREMSAELNASYHQRDSNVSGNNYRREVVFARIRFQM